MHMITLKRSSMIKFLLTTTVALGMAFTANAQQVKTWTLKDCIDHALEHNISIKQVQLDKDVAIQDVTAAKWNFSPNVNASASQTYNFGSSITVQGNRASANFRSNNFGVNASVVLFNGFSNMHTLKQSKIRLEQQEALISKVKNDVSLNVANAYLGVLFAQEQVKVAAAQLGISEKEAVRIETLVELGGMAKADLLTIQATVAGDQQNLVVAQNSASIALLQLAQLLQLDERSMAIESVAIGSQDQVVFNQDVHSIYHNALSAFPEIKAAELNVDAASEGIQLSKSGFYPSLTMSYGINTVYQRVQGVPDVFSFSEQLDNNLGNTLALSLNIPLFNKYQTKTTVAKTAINHQRMQNNLAQEQQLLKENVQRAYADALAASKAYDAAVVAANAAQTAFDFGRERLAEGALDAYAFNQIKNDLFVAQSQLIRAKYDYLFKVKVVEFYNGSSLAEL